MEILLIQKKIPNGQSTIFKVESSDEEVHLSTIERSILFSVRNSEIQFNLPVENYFEPDEEWVHMVLTSNFGDVSIYKDGHLSASHDFNMTHALAKKSRALFIGGTVESGACGATIAFVRIWFTVLQLDRVKALFSRNFPAIWKPLPDDTTFIRKDLLSLTRPKTRRLAIIMYGETARWRNNNELSMCSSEAINHQIATTGTQIERIFHRIEVTKISLVASSLLFIPIYPSYLMFQGH